MTTARFVWSTLSGILAFILGMWGLGDIVGSVVKDSTELNLEAKTGQMENATTKIERDLKGDFRLRLHPPCENLDAGCYITLSVNYEPPVVPILTGLLLVGTVFFLWGVALLRRPARMIAVLGGKKLSVTFAISEDEIFTARLAYEGLETRDEQLRLPCSLHYDLPTHDGSTVGIQDLRLIRDRTVDPAITLAPDFLKTRHRATYDGNIDFSRGQKGPVSFSVVYKVAKNFCLTADGFHKRWGAHNTLDSFTFGSAASWGELEIKFCWPKTFKTDGPPWVTTKLTAGAQENMLSRNSQWDPETWTLKQKGVPAGQEYVFRWHIG